MNAYPIFNSFSNSFSSSGIHCSPPDRILSSDVHTFISQPAPRQLDYRSSPFLTSRHCSAGQWAPGAETRDGVSLSNDQVSSLSLSLSLLISPATQIALTTDGGRAADRIIGLAPCPVPAVRSGLRSVAYRSLFLPCPALIAHPFPLPRAMLLLVPMEPIPNCSVHCTCYHWSSVPATPDCPFAKKHDHEETEIRGKLRARLTEREIDTILK